jgi:hypothetical protein
MPNDECNVEESLIELSTLLVVKINGYTSPIMAWPVFVSLRSACWMSMMGSTIRKIGFYDMKSQNTYKVTTQVRRYLYAEWFL